MRKAACIKSRERVYRLLKIHLATSSPDSRPETTILTYIRAILRNGWNTECIIHGGELRSFFRGITPSETVCTAAARFSPRPPAVIGVKYSEREEKKCACEIHESADKFARRAPSIHRFLRRTNGGLNPGGIREDPLESTARLTMDPGVPGSRLNLPLIYQAEGRARQMLHRSRVTRISAIYSRDEYHRDLTLRPLSLSSLFLLCLSRNFLRLLVTLCKKKKICEITRTMCVKMRNCKLFNYYEKE